MFSEMTWIRATLFQTAVQVDCRVELWEKRIKHSPKQFSIIFCLTMQLPKQITNYTADVTSVFEFSRHTLTVASQSRYVYLVLKKCYLVTCNQWRFAIIVITLLLFINPLHQRTLFSTCMSHFLYLICAVIKKSFQNCCFKSTWFQPFYSKLIYACRQHAAHTSLLRQNIWSF